ncbi:hypothetical protein A9Q82_10120 [Cycloclasticus sp. 46_120_T64]|nr:hypothetical protein A9Q82_10120 [Cycloclasticus sp. 46_120_T64]
MYSHKEAQCIEAVTQLRIKAANRAADKNRVVFKKPLGRLRDVSQWKKTPANRVKQILALPAALIRVVSILLLLPITAGLHRYKIYQLQQQHKTALASAYTSNSLDSLWHSHGLNEASYSETVCLDLLTQWVNILYGKDAAEAVDIKEMAGKHNTLRATANIPHYTAEIPEDFPRFYFGSTINAVVRRLSEQLGEYAK